MLYIETGSSDAAFNFSLEEYFVRKCGNGKNDGSCEAAVMIWQAEDCVMVGCNQVAEAEADVGYARESGIQIVRRSSGGGTIYTDMGTFLFSMIMPHPSKHAYPADFAREASVLPVLGALIKLGVPAVFAGRNDILVHGKKVSGLARYSIGNMICTHGSLLFHADLNRMERALRVEEGKLRYKSLRSVRSRVANLSDFLDFSFSTQDFFGYLKQHLFSELAPRAYALTAADLEGANEICRLKYGKASWTFRQPPKFSFQNSLCFPGGKLDVYLDVAGGTVSSCAIHGDFLGVAPISGLEKLFVSKPFDRFAFADSLRGVDMQPFLGGITKDEFMSCIFGCNQEEGGMFDKQT